MLCSTCNRESDETFNFCPYCGQNIRPRTGLAPQIPRDLTEEQAIRYYFRRGFQYNDILWFLSKFHEVIISYRTLLNRLHNYGLRRRLRDVNEEEVRCCIQAELDGPGSSLGYRAMWRTVVSKYGIHTPRSMVERLLRELDAAGTEQRRSHRLRRREYRNHGPNYCWHADGYDKLKPYGFPIHGCIDGHSRRVLWLSVSRTNNNPAVIAGYFLQSAEVNQGCPVLLRTDRGTENTVMAAIQCYFRRNGNDELAGGRAHRYGASTSNQRIESWWAQLRKSWSNWWMDVFKRMIFDGQLDVSNELEKECLWFCFNKLLQKELDQVRERWNTHYIIYSHHTTQAGIPEQMYFIPESYGTEDFKVVISHDDIIEMQNNVTLTVANEYEEYFTEVMDAMNLHHPESWREGLELYQRLIAIN